MLFVLGPHATQVPLNVSEKFLKSLTELRTAQKDELSVENQLEKLSLDSKGSDDTLEFKDLTED